MTEDFLKVSEFSDINTFVNRVCPNCQHDRMLIFHKVNNVPVHSVFNILSREEAIDFPRGNIFLGLCSKCGFISNTSFDPGLLMYSSSCEESQDYSPTFKKFLHRMAIDLVEKYNLYHKQILEIGCGKGQFLKLLCELGENTGLGFDPAFVNGRHKSKKKNHVTIIKDFYSEKYANFRSDFICCRMTLEHIYDTAKFISVIRRSIEHCMNTVVFFQVPNVIRILKNYAFEDIYYEHCSYFSPGSLVRLFRKCGFEIFELKTVYHDQYIVLEAKPSYRKVSTSYNFEEDLECLRGYVSNFCLTYPVKLDPWRLRIQEIKASGKKAVLWGSGSKGVAFLTTLGILYEIDYVVDINPHRQKTYMAGTGQLIVAPKFLKQYKPDIVIIMNQIYCGEIQQELFQMGLSPQILTL